MIPLRPAGSHEGAPWLTWVLIATNVVVAVLTLILPTGGEIMRSWSLRPDVLFSAPFTVGGVPTLITSIFLHAGWLHLIGNMVYLAAFGPLVEERLGRLRMLTLYLVAGALGMFVQAIAFPDANTAIVGASGAIAGILGAALTLAHRSPITTAVPAWVTIEIAELPAGFLVMVWIVVQIAAMKGSSLLDGGGVAYFAHLGGIAAGIVVAFLFARGGRRIAR